MKNKKSLGQARNIRFELTEPMKITIDNMDLNSITLLVGQNGSGKTLINKLVFFASLATLYDLAYRNNPIVMQIVDESQTGVQFIFDNTFMDPQEFSGHITVHFENGTFECDVEKGILDKVITSYDQGVTEGSYPKYMSTNTRLFQQMEAILIMDKMLPDSGVLKHYKLFDLMHCHRMRDFAVNVSTLNDDLQKTLKEHYDTDVVSVHYDENNCQFSFTDSTGKTKLASSYAAGNQAIVNMMLGVNY